MRKHNKFLLALSLTLFAGFIGAQMLTANEAKADSDPSKFKVGRLSDYLIEGYSQIDRGKSLKLK